MNPESDPAKDRILVAVSGDSATARVVGRGSFKISSSMKEFGTSLIESGIKNLDIDLGECIGMDSTFMGMLAGLSQRFRRQNGGSINLHRVSPKILGLLNTLGLIRMVNIVEGGATPQPAEGMNELVTKPETPLESAKSMLEAHEKLVEIDESNRQRFQDVLDYLREDISRQRGA